jgi:rRNA maturation protein Nop10
MAGMAVDSNNDEDLAVKSGPDDEAALPPRTRRSRANRYEVPIEPTAEEREASIRAARPVYRLSCFACGRSTDVATPPPRPGRCPNCGGTLLLELATD